MATTPDPRRAWPTRPSRPREDVARDASSTLLDEVGIASALDGAEMLARCWPGYVRAGQGVVVGYVTPRFDHAGSCGGPQ